MNIHTGLGQQLQGPCLYGGEAAFSHACTLVAPIICVPISIPFERMAASLARVLEYLKQCHQPAAPSVTEACTDPHDRTCSNSGEGGGTAVPSSCGLASFSYFLLTQMPLIAAVSFFAMAIPCVIRIKYGRRLEGISAGAAIPGQQPAPAPPDLEHEPLPFESFGVHILAELRLGPLVRGFVAAARLAADSLSESLILRTVCIPIGVYYPLVTVTSRFSSGDEVRPMKGPPCMLPTGLLAVALLQASNCSEVML